MVWNGPEMKTAVLAILCALIAPGPARPAAQQPPPAVAPASSITLRATDHPPLPADPAQFWMIPGRVHTTRTPALNAFAAAVKLEVDGNFSKALPALSQSLLRDHVLNEYVQYYKGLAELSAGRTADALRTFQTLAATPPAGYLMEAAALREAECREALGDYAAALAIYERLSNAKTTEADTVLLRLGMAAQASGDPDRALKAFSRVYYEFPFSDLASAAGLALDRLPNRPALGSGTTRYRLDLGRAEQLFGGRRYAQARNAFEALKPAAQGNDVELVNLRLAESDYFLKRVRPARDGVKPYIEKASRQGEALFFYAVASYDLGDRAEYFRIVRRVADEFPTQTWAEEGLNHLATHYIVNYEDAKADATFREMFERFPSGRYAERAAWKIGWLAYSNRDYPETIRVFERAAATFPRSDYRPPWLYWSARAYDALQQTAQAEARYKLTATDYFNSYYGRLAVSHLDSRRPRRQMIAELQAVADATAESVASGPDPAVSDAEESSAGGLPPNAELIRALLGLGLYDQAVNELQYAQKVWGDGAAIKATLAWTYQKQGTNEKGSRQFTLYRSAINTMKRAYPHYLAAEGERLPKELVRIIFPLDYWDLIRKYSAANQLDPFLIAALVAQESTFVRDVRSPVKAVGLMQLMTPTARAMARKLKMRYSAALLTTPDASIRMGTAYFAQTLKEFGEPHLVLASYNAGERAVRRWVSERPGVPRDEFIDDIPFPETQNYVKRILGTAEDYRRLYEP
jgi:soluble lytic murein transglycosylase